MNDDQTFSTRERLFWVGVRKALIELIRAIEIRFGLESAIITNEQRKRLRRLELNDHLDIGRNIG